MAAKPSCLSAAKGDERKELSFEEVAKEKYCMKGPVFVSP